MSTSSEIREKLKRQSLFMEFTNDELDEFVDLLDPVHAAAGDTIVKQDEKGDCMYLLLEGTARVVHHKDGHDIYMAALNAGDFFGELALVDDGLRSADVQALTPCTLLKITQAVIAALAGVYPSAAFKFLIAVGRILVNRLRQTNQRFVDTLLFPVQGGD